MKKIAIWIKKEKLGVIVVAAFLLSLLPVFYVGLFNYASGDDYWYGVNTYRGWVESGLLGALKGSFATIKDFYYHWQGTWFTMFLFTLSPNHFMENGYVIVVFLSIGLLSFSFYYLGNFYLVKKLQFNYSTFLVVLCAVLYLAIQYIPRTTSGIYWFNGIMHYTVPFFLGIIALVHSHKFLEYKKKRDFILLFLSFILLGGGSYLAPVCVSILVCLLMISQLRIAYLPKEKRKLKVSYDKRNIWILLALAAEAIGLLISFLAPGNNVRGGEEFGFSIKWALTCVYYAIDRGIYLGIDYFEDNIINTLVYIILVLIIWIEMWKKEYDKKQFRYPLLFVLLMNAVYWAGYTPEIYSRSDVSGGVTNTYYHIFLLVTLTNIVYVHGWVIQWIKKKRISGVEKEMNQITAFHLAREVFVAVGIGLLIFVEKADNLKTTNDYCIEYIQSGKMYRYAEVRKEQHRILSDENIQEAVIPEMGEQYPLLHMELEESAEGQINVDIALYYGKKSVIAEIVEEYVD